MPRILDAPQQRRPARFRVAKCAYDLPTFRYELQLPMHSLKALGVPIRASRTAAATWLILCLALTGTATEAPAQTHAVVLDRIGYSPEELTAIARLLAGTHPESDSRALPDVGRNDAWGATRHGTR